MFVLDTNHFRELGYQSLLGQKLQSRLNECAEDVFITVVSVTESVKGRLAQVSAARRLEDEINAYRQVSLVVRHLAAFTHLPWDAEAAARFKAFRQQGIRIGTMDLRIACIVLEHDATLLTRNTGDFAQVPRLRFENWLD